MTMIALAKIDPPKFNSRLIKTGKAAKDDQAKLEQLAAEFQDKRIGQQTAIEVEEKADGRYELVFGDRRRRAALLAGWTEINAEVRAPAPDADKAYRNIVENLGRENLTVFETARAANFLRESGMKNPEIATILHKSPSHVSNLHTAYSGLPAPVRKDWEGNHPAATVEVMADIARKGKDDEDKVKRWDEVAEAARKREAAGQKVGKRGKAVKGDGGGGGGFPVSQKRLAHVLKALSSKGGSPELSDETRKWGKALLDYVVKGRESPPGGVPKIPEKVKAEKEEKGDE